LIVERLQARIPDHELTDDYPILKTHVIDSIGILQLAGLIEEEFGVGIDDEELVVEHFGTIGDIARLIEAKQAASA
jgi:acyl carrier protein